MNELNWIHQIQWQDVSKPLTELKEEDLYTLYMGDFLNMPEVDYFELVHIDPMVRALLN